MSRFIFMGVFALLFLGVFLFYRIRWEEEAPNEPSKKDDEAPTQ